MEKKNEMKPLDEEMLDMVSGGMSVFENIKCPYCGAAFLLRDNRSSDDYQDHVKECRKTHSKA